jgi:hypothetical protein
MRHLVRGVLIMFICLLAACESADGPTEIRLMNSGAVPLQDVVVVFPDTTENFSDIAPGEATSFRTIPRAYRYAKIEAVVEGQPTVLQPEDYVGEKLLGRGQFTYSLSYNADAQSEHDRLDLKCVRE